MSELLLKMKRLRLRPPFLGYVLCFKTNVICRTALEFTFGVPGQFRHELRGSQGVYHGRGQVHRRGHRTLFTQRNARGRARTRGHALHLEVSHDEGKIFQFVPLV